jgi:integrase
MKPPGNRSDGFQDWTDSEIAAFETRWPLGTKQRLVFDLLLYTGQRSGDVRKMSAGQVAEGYIRLVQEKTCAPIEIPVHSVLKASMSACRNEHLLLVTTEYGKPFTAKGFGNWFSAVAREAGLSGCSAQGLRKSAARKLADAGCTVHQIAAITGHRSLGEVQRYTRAADQKRNAEEAMRKVEQTDRERKNV